MTGMRTFRFGHPDDTSQNPHLVGRVAVPTKRNQAGVRTAALGVELDCIARPSSVGSREPLPYERV